MVSLRLNGSAWSCDNRLVVCRLAVLAMICGCGRIGFGDPSDVTIPCTTPLLRDDFDHAIDSTLWQPTSSMAVGGALTLMPERVGAFVGLTTELQYDYSNHWIAFRMIAPPALGSMGAAGIRLFLPGEQDYPYVVVRDGMVAVGSYTPTTTAPLLEIAHDPVEHRLIRMRHSGATVHWDVSADAATWTELAQAMTPTIWGRSYLRVYASDEAEPLDAEATLDAVVVCADVTR
jgi:hypothetical protein